MIVAPRPARTLGGLLAAALVASLALAGGTTDADAASPATSPATTAKAVKPCASTPFRSNGGKRVYYRIPALVTTRTGTLLAFAERRRSTGPASDRSDTEIVLARSTDRGCHWSAPRVIADRSHDTVGNPAPVVDPATGTVLLFTMDRAPGGSTFRGLHLQRSTDDGRTFTPYARAYLDLTKVKGWHGGLTGPGHALVLTSPKSAHRGRIIVPLGFQYQGRYGAYGIYSDNHGASWKVGYSSLGGDGRIEGTVAELADGRLWISYRNREVTTPVGIGRISAWSANGGTSLSAGFRRAGLPTVSVQGSGLGLSGRYAGVLLHSSPIGKDRTRRQGMGIFVSRGSTAGKTWSKPHVVVSTKQPAAYSDLTLLDAATLGLLYETGSRTWKERIDFKTLRIADVVR